MNVFRWLVEKIRHAKALAKLNERQQRFTDIINDTRCNVLSSIFPRLAQGDSNLTDQEILDSYFAFSNKIQTNTFAAAELEWVTVATLCAHRPHLTGTLIRRGLLSIVWSIGDEITNEDVLAFLDHRVLASNAMPYGGLPPDAGLTWLKDELPKQKALIQHVLEEVIQQNKKDLAELNG